MEEKQKVETLFETDKERLRFKPVTGLDDLISACKNDINTFCYEENRLLRYVLHYREKLIFRDLPPVYIEFLEKLDTCGKNNSNNRILMEKEDVP